MPGRLPTVSHCPTAQTHDATRAGSLARCGPVDNDHTTRVWPATRCSIDALRLRTRARWAAHATWHSAARPSAPAHGESLPHGSNARRHARAALLAFVGRSPTSTTHACHFSGCSIDALGLRTSQMGCSGCMAVGSTCQGVCTHGESLPHGLQTRRQTRGQPCLLVGLSPITTTKACH